MRDGGRKVKRLWIWTIFAKASVLAVGCATAEVVSNRARPVLMTIGGNTGPAWEVRLADGRAYLWRRPAVEYRPVWAGQVTRLGLRYTRWSNGTWDLGVPLRGAAVVFGAAGLAPGAVLLRRRLRASRGFPVSPVAPGS
jgi:hypothetical protein